MAEPQDVEQCVLMDVEPGSGGSVRARRPVEKTFRRYDQDQPMLLAPDLRDWLPGDHPARWVDDLVEHGLDLTAFFDDYTVARGAPPYEPRLMVRLCTCAVSKEELRCGAQSDAVHRQQCCCHGRDEAMALIPDIADLLGESASRLFR